MSYIKDTNEAIATFVPMIRRLKAKYGDKITASMIDLNSSEMEGYYLSVKSIASSHTVYWNPDEDIYEEVAKLMEPKFIQVTKICIDMIGQEIYLNKEEIVTVESIDKTGVRVKLESGHMRTVGPEDLWLLR